MTGRILSQKVLPNLAKRAEDPELVAANATLVIRSPEKKAKVKAAPTPKLKRAPLTIPGLWQTPPWTTEERLQRIQAMAERITGYVQFIGAVGTLNGSSAEAKENAVAAFYEQMIVMVDQLGRIREELQLG